jgi:hypothetical protein
MELIVLAAALLVYWGIRSLVLIALRTRAISKQKPPG